MNKIEFPVMKPNPERYELLAGVDMASIPDALKERIIRAAIVCDKESRSFLWFEMPHEPDTFEMWSDAVELMKAVDEIAVM